MVVTFTVDARKVNRWFRRMPSAVEKNGLIGIDEFGKLTVQRILQQAKIVGIKQFRSNRSMFTNTKYERKGNIGAIFMPMSGVYQDRAKSHFVSINRSKPMLWAWSRRYQYRSKVLWFTKKPFIKAGVRNARRGLDPIMRLKLRKALKEAKT